MKANELRIGNWVWNDVQNLPVKVDMQILNEQYYADRGIGQSWLPFPLTEEILLKCGFIKVRYEKYAHNKLNKLRAFPHVMKEGFGIYMMGSYTLPHIKYLHQLQNLYFELTGQELDIKLMKE